MAQIYGWNLNGGGPNTCCTIVTSRTPSITYVPPSTLALLLNPALVDKKYHKAPNMKSVHAKLSTKKHALVAAPGSRKQPAKRPLSKITQATTPRATPAVEPEAHAEPAEKKKKRALIAAPPRVETISPPVPIETLSDSPQRVHSNQPDHSRISLGVRVKHLGLKAHSDRSLSSTATIRIICLAPEGSPEMERAQRLMKSLGKFRPAINARIPKEGSVASSMTVTHVVVPAANVPSLFTTVAISKGAWRVPYEWAEKTLELSRKAGKIELANEIDEAFSPISFRSKYYFFAGKTFINHLTDEKKRDEIHVVLDQAGAVCVTNPNQKAQIVVVNDGDLPPDRPNDPTYWIYSDFQCPFESAALSGRASEFRDWNN